MQFLFFEPDRQIGGSRVAFKSKYWQLYIFTNYLNISVVTYKYFLVVVSVLSSVSDTMLRN